MEKGQGIAVTAVLAAALLFRQGGSGPSPDAEPAEGGKSGTNSSAPSEAQVGPWIASCNYWAPARIAANEPPEAPPEVFGTLSQKDGRINLHVVLDRTDKKEEAGCGSDRFDRWGFPVGADVTAIVATVPDPVHTHLALAFDRTVDAILQAASDNNYVSSYYWLPWKNRVSGMKFADSVGDAEPGHDPERERQPGLMILKSGNSGNGVPPPGSFFKVVYLFLVAETPTQGVVGFQLQNAFSYEAELKLALVARQGRFSMGNGRVAIIGPQYSGSAASLRAGIETVLRNRTLDATEFEVTGATTTALPLTLLGYRGATYTAKVRYLSFASNADYNRQTIIDRLAISGYDIGRLALLLEDNTAYASAALASPAIQNVMPSASKNGAQVIRFPREISLLRNAQVTAGQSGNGMGPAAAPFSPYLHFSLKDYSAQDSVPQFSRENTPLSQEAELMTIARQLHSSRAQFIAISGSNPLDLIFLAQFLHRACPDARLLFLGPDLLMVREIDNVPFLGSITVTPYPLIGLRTAQRAYTDSTSEGFYNAVSYTFWRNGLLVGLKQLALQGYRSPLAPRGFQQPSLWATAIGRDGYYPLAILNACASNNSQFLPAFDSQGNKTNESCRAQLALPLPTSIIYPSLPWAVLWVAVCFLCLLHTGMLLVADYWSPFTRDLAIRENDQPRRRSTYIHVATTMLFSMVFVVSFPVLRLSHTARVGPASEGLSITALGLGLAAVIVAIWKTWGYIGWARPGEGCWDSSTGPRRMSARVYANVYLFLNLAALTALIGFCGLWAYLCCTESASGSTVDPSPGAHSYLVGLAFCYRSIHPGSGVSPIEPVLLLLFSWYLWGVFQTWRLRFSTNGRPQLPRRLGNGAENRTFFVSDDDLEIHGGPLNGCLFKNITCLLITRDVLHRFFRPKQPAREPAGVNGHGDHMALDIVLVAAYGALLLLFSFFTPMHSLDHFLWNTGNYLSCPYEGLVGALFFPLIAVSLTGWLRMLLIWSALKRGLLERLENMPVRYAFSRLKVMGWMTMLRSGGLQEQWSDMARSLESMRQILHHPDLKGRISEADWRLLEKANSEVLTDVADLRSHISGATDEVRPGWHYYDSMKKIETGLGTFGQRLLSMILIPHWNNIRTGLVESEVIRDDPDQSRRSQTQPAGSTEPARILVAEEFLAIRYISLIRAVLTNLRYLMIFVSTSFVLAVWAWNSYPFQPRQLGDWAFTSLLGVLGFGVIWVFAQMHRNPILSRITDTRANELGWDFYLRVISFGALPIITWLAYQFPDIGNLISKFLQPGVPVIK